tara:strand:- start:253 stop:534 length:282 start_codon:yes stop_codon:yes gene_type:complete
MGKIKLLKKTIEYLKKIKKRKKKKVLSEKEKNTYSMKEDSHGSLTSGFKPSGKVSPERLDRNFKKGGAVKKRAKSSSKGTGVAIRGTKFKGVF